MATIIYGGTIIQPLEAYVSASQQQTTFVFISNDSGSYIYSGSNPDFIFDGTASYHTSSLTFEDSGSTFSFVFSGSGYGTPSPSLPGTTLSASINGLSSSADIAAAFTASVVAATNMTASIISSSIVVLTNSAFSSSATTTSSFSPGTLGVYTTQVGHPSGYLSGSDTTGSLTVNGGFEVQGNRPVNIGTDKAAGTPTVNVGDKLIIDTNSSNVIISGSLSISGSASINGSQFSGIQTQITVIPAASASQAHTTPVLLGIPTPPGRTPNIINAFQFVSPGGIPYTTYLTSSLRSSGSADDLFLATSLSDTSSNEYRFIPQPTYNAVNSRDIVWTILDGNPPAGDRDVTVAVSYIFI